MNTHVSPPLTVQKDVICNVLSGSCKGTQPGNSPRLTHSYLQTVQGGEKIIFGGIV